jgi:hypothetical protein
MMKQPRIIFLMFDAKSEVYRLIDTHYKPMPKNPDGSINEYGPGLANNDIDALRHSFVSGAYVMEYDEETADKLGRLNEFKNFSFGTKEIPSENMDLWNNSVGRLYGKKSKTWDELFQSLLQALRKGELIIDLKDPRKYKGEKTIKRMPKSFVIKVKENKTGANIQFLDVHRKIVLTKDEFIASIKQGKYPGYAVKKHYSGEFPYSTRDKFSFNNLG